MKITMAYKNETRTCYRFESGNRDDGSQMTLYLKKFQVEDSGINPRKGITVTVEEAQDNDNI